MTVTVRPRSADDIPELAAVLLRVYEKDGYPVEGVDNPEAWLRHKHELASWVATGDGQLVGQITLASASPDDDAARAWQEHTGGKLDRLAIPARLFVDPAGRGAGAGRSLMRTAVAYAQSNGFAIAFDVMLKDAAAIRLYEGLGAQRIATIIHRYGEGMAEPAAVYILP